jgi:D-alanyl-lipoteichoic acid acyltransferase DltB (MBOAT superfamily)
MNISLLSLEFFALSVAAIAVLASLNGITRQLAFLVVNVFFLWGLVLGPQGASSTIVFCLLGYALVRFIVRYPRAGFWIGLFVSVGLFVYMRRYDFLTFVVPGHMLTQALSTIGLSFLFFKVVHVMVEARSGTLGALQFSTFLNYCLNFTTFVMGPIQRYQDFRGQWYGVNEAIPLNFDAHLDAMLRIFVGLVKIYILAVWFESMALRSNTDLLELSPIGLFVQVYSFYFFLYLNFSGYCDVVIGVGSLMGVKPPENFNWPFVAQNISDFWLRQHRSLTLWLTDYIFSPTYKWALTNRWLSSYPLLAVNGALMVTMLISGLWHGTTLSFFLFGVAHGLFFVIYRTWDTLLVRQFGVQKVRAWRTRWPVRLFGIALTFNATAFAFIFFRLDTAQIEKVLHRVVFL